MVSFIIPAYNCENYIRECIESIIHQNESSFEIIIINDGSKDTTPAILEEYAKLDARIRVFHTENSGPSRARNIGLDNALGDWIIFVDADDWVDKDILTKLDLYSNNVPDIVFWGFKRCYEDNKIEVCMPKEFNVALENNSINQQLSYLLNSKEEFLGYSWNKIYKRNIIQKFNIRFREELNFREDELFALNYCLHINSAMTIAYSPYNYRIISKSLSHNTDIVFRNYNLLAQNENAILSSLQDSSFKDALVAKVFMYYIASIMECLFFKREEIKQVIKDSCSFYDKYNHCLNLPIWQNILFSYPINAIRNSLVYYIFKIRLTFKGLL